MKRQYRFIHVLGSVALLLSMAASLLATSAPIAAQEGQGQGQGNNNGNSQNQEANQQAQESPEAADLDRGRPNEYPTAVTLEDQQYLFDRLVPISRQELTRVGQDRSTQYFARDDEGPFDQLYVSVPNRSEDELARYLPTRIDSPDEPCPAEDGDLGTLNAGDTAYAFAGPEPDFTPDQLQEVGDAGGQTIYSFGEQPFDELFLEGGQGLQRFIAVDEDGLPAVLTDDVPFGEQTLTFSANATNEVDPGTLTKVGCAGAFPVLAADGEVPGSLSEAYCSVGGQILLFTAAAGAPTADDGDDEEANQQDATEETTADAEETATTAPEGDEETVTPADEATPEETVTPDEDDEDTAATTDLTVEPGGAPDEGDGGQPEGLPRELIVGDVRYLFDRLVTLERQDLIRVAQDGPFIVYARGEQPPFDRIYVSLPPRDEGELARYLPEVLDSPDNPCPAEGQNLGRVTAGDAAYAFAGLETDVTEDVLQEVGQAQERTIFAEGDQPFIELFLSDPNGLLRFIVLDAEGRPAPLQDSLLFGGQLFTFSADVTDQTDVAALARAGCSTAFPVFAEQDEEAGAYTQLYVQVGGSLLLFTAEGAAAPATEAPATPVPATAAPATEAPAETGEIRIIKRFCEADNSPNANSNCNGRIQEAEGTTVTFQVFEGEATSGGPVTTIDVPIERQGNGSQGQATSDADAALGAGETFTVCEVPVDGFTAVPRPGAQGGRNQTSVDGEPCIRVDLTPGTNVLQFNNFLAEQVQPAAPTNTPVPLTNTPVPPTNTPVPPTATPVPPTNTPTPVPATNTPAPAATTPVATQPAATQAAQPTRAPQQATVAPAAPTATQQPQGPVFIPTLLPQAPRPAAATAVPARCSGDVGAVLGNGLPERLPRRIQLGGITYTFVRVEDATAAGEATRIGCVGPFEVVSTNLAPQAQLLYLRVFGAQRDITYFRFEAIRTFNVTLQVTGNPRVISSEDQSYVIQRTLVQSIYSSVSVTLYVERADDPAPAVIYARQGKDDPVIARYEPEGEIREASAEMLQAAEATGINPDLTLNGRRYILIDIYEPVGATGNGFITFYGVGDAETQEFVIGYDPRRLDLVIYVPR